MYQCNGSLYSFFPLLVLSDVANLVTCPLRLLIQNRTLYEFYRISVKNP